MVGSRNNFGQANSRQGLGKDGCYTSQGFVTNTIQTSKVVIKPLTEIINHKNEINSLSLGLNSKANEIRQLAQKCQNNYQKYLDTPVPVCGSGVVGWLGKAAGTGAYQECLAAVDKLREPVMSANTQFTEMAGRVSDLNADYSELMQYAPSVLDWQKLCQSKLDLDLRHKQLRDANSKLGEAALKKMQAEATLQDKADNEHNTFEQFLKQFLDALTALIQMVLAVFESFLRSLTKFSAFVADHPTLVWVGGGFIGLSVLAFIFRPYISILGMAVGRKK
jgi:hypothetical protein